MPMVFAIFFISLFAVYTTMTLPAQEAQIVAAAADARSTNVISYKAALVEYLNSNPAFTGVIPDASITLPIGSIRDLRWKNVVNSRVLYVYESTPSQTRGLLDSIYRKTNKSILVGTSNGTNLINAAGFQTGVVIPVVTPSIPTGSIVLVGK